MKELENKQYKVLFVDDEPRILSGLRRQMHSQKGQFSAEYVSSGADALAYLEKVRVDAVVTDMRMPEMNGAALLRRVCEVQPETVRFVLSGHSDDDDALEASNYSHRFLRKPCDGELLTSSLLQAFSLRSILQNPDLRRRVHGFGAVPTLPDIWTKLVEMLKSKDVSIDGVGKVISGDPGLTTKVLQLVNSSYFGLPRQISSPAQAVSMLGINVIRGLVLAIGLGDQFSISDAASISIREILEEGLLVGELSKHVLSDLGGTIQDCDDVYTAGLLHDIGLMVLVQEDADTYSEPTMLHNRPALLEIERNRFGATHNEVGAYLVGLWNLPPIVTECIAFHHNPLNIKTLEPEAVVSLQIAHALVDEIAIPDALQTLDLYEEIIGAPRLGKWRKMRDRKLPGGGE